MDKSNSSSRRFPQYNRTHSNSTSSSRYRQSVNQNWRHSARERRNSSSAEDQAENPDHFANSNTRKGHLKHSNSISKPNETLQGQYTDDKFHRNSQVNHHPEKNKFNLSDRRKSHDRALLDQSSAGDKTDTTAGTVINGRYVRNSSLNADATPFVPQTQGNNVSKSASGTKLRSPSLRQDSANSNWRNAHTGMYLNLNSHSRNSKSRYSQDVSRTDYEYDEYFEAAAASSTSEMQDHSLPKHRLSNDARPRSSSLRQTSVNSNWKPGFHSGMYFNFNARSGSSKNTKWKNSDRSSARADLCADVNEYEAELVAASGVNEVHAHAMRSKNSPKEKIQSVPKSDITQRERLVLQLETEDCECLVCCESIRIRDYVWSCGNCYHVFHLRCIKKWARSPTAIVKDLGWRCPACQNINDKVPDYYYCFCGKCVNPEMNLHYTPHSCGEVCGKQREDTMCVHRCNILCHPGPCPTCTATVNRSCACGKLKKVVPCAQTDAIICTSICEKVLNCGKHRCKELCHTGNCAACDVYVTQKCYCGKEERKVLCDQSTVGVPGYCCEELCQKKLACGSHHCSSTCHPGACDTCNLLPDLITSCPCGKTPLQELQDAGKAAVRKSCTDPVPVCGQKCDKVLVCGPKGNHHKCISDCHCGTCPPCKLTTMMKCRCGSTSKEMACTEISKDNFVFHCERRCNKRKDCGRHKCLNNCCVFLVHKCELVCNKKLTCGLHHCQQTCHAGNCHTCWNVSFDELRCHCGHSVIYPPVACGTRPPECDQPCIRSHPCDHKVQHTCHSDEKCPPCTILTTKMCFGHHELRSSVQCFLDGISCGKLCNKPLPCERHHCIDVCHDGSCIKSGIPCSQPCVKLRSCGHPCSAPCHEGDCPETACKTKVEVTCPCGLRREVTSCSEDLNAYRLLSVTMMASKMQDIKAGESVNLNEIFGKKGKPNRLQCTEECAVIERNKRLAVALQIQNPDLSCKPGPPSYSEFIKEEMKKNGKFVTEVFNKLTELVQLAKQSKQKSRSYAFPPMKRDHRRVIHELAPFFGCETQSYDEEPVKNVVITASREKSWLPFVSIMTVVERDMGIRRVPTPVVSCATKVLTPQTSLEEKKEKVIDYFDFEG